MSAAKETNYTYVWLAPGDPAPRFRQRSSSGDTFHLDKTAGRYSVLCFYGTAADSGGEQAVGQAYANRHLFDGKSVAFFGVSLDTQDPDRMQQHMPDLQFLWDFDASVSRLYGASPREMAAPKGNVQLRRFWIVLDPMLRVMKVVSFKSDGSESIEVFQFLETLPPPERFTGTEMQAPVLMLPNVFEPDLCRKLIDLYETHGGTESGFMREKGGKTVLVVDPVHKRRKDYCITDMALIEQTKQRIARRVIPEIARAFQFHATRVERFIVACYAAEDDGHFNTHRDNTMKGTAHRRFAVSLNLNEDYEGGEICFPEFGPRRFKPPPGAAVIFSCSLLHAASPVTRGQRYVFLPFLYDEAAAAIREQNNQYLDPAIRHYSAG